MSAPPHAAPPGPSFSPENFRASGHALIDALARHLEAARNRDLGALPPLAPSEEFAHWKLGAEPRGVQGLSALVADVLARSNHLHHPGYVGHQVSAPHPLAALGELVAGFLNNSMAVYEMGPAATAIERALVLWFARGFGLPSGADGLLTSGGSAGNLTALLAMRELRAGFPAWHEGAHAGPPLCVLVSEEAHYCIARAAQILGWGKAGAWPVPVDERFRMRADALPAALAAARAAGRVPIGVVASACTTAAGAFDPLDDVASFCAREGLWMHVDGAHGAVAALSPRLAHLVKGLDRADSIVADAHKMLLVPGLCTAVVFREGRHACAAFAQEAAYLFGTSAHDHGLRTLECTKRMLGLPLYLLLACVGREELVRHVERCFALASSFAARLRSEPDFELALEPQANIVCFRHVPSGIANAPRAGTPGLDALQSGLRSRVVAGGRFYLVQTRLGGATWLRTTLINPFTTEDDLAELLRTIRAAAPSI